MTWEKVGLYFFVVRVELRNCVPSVNHNNCFPTISPLAAFKVLVSGRTLKRHLKRASFWKMSGFVSSIVLHYKSQAILHESYRWNIFWQHCAYKNYTVFTTWMSTQHWVWHGSVLLFGGKSNYDFFNWWIKQAE